MPGCEDRDVFACVALSRADVADPAVPVVVVVPMHELARPFARGVQVREAFSRELGPVLRRAEQAFDEGVVVAHARPRVRRLDAQPPQHGQHRGGLQRGAVVAMQHGSLVAWHGVNALGQRGALHEPRGMVTVVLLVHLEAHDLAAEDIEDQVQVEPASGDFGRQERHVPAPQLARCGGDVRGRRPALARRLGAAPMARLALRAQHALEGGLGGDVVGLAISPHPR